MKQLDGNIGRTHDARIGGDGTVAEGRDPSVFTEISAPEVTYFDSGTPQRINGREALNVEDRSFPLVVQ
jgi:hypothetical protein